jgi:hypothetical protein
LGPPSAPMLILRILSIRTSLSFKVKTIYLNLIMVAFC